MNPHLKGKIERQFVKQQKSQTTNHPTGATPRKLDKRELHTELRRADTIIATAWESMSIDSRIKLIHDLSQIGITTAHDPLASTNRKQALKRTKPCRDYLMAVLLMLLVFFATAFGCSQTENQLLQAERAQKQQDP